MSKNNDDKDVLIGILIAMLLCAICLAATPKKDTSWMTDEEFNDYMDTMQEYQLDNYLPY